MHSRCTSVKLNAALFDRQITSWLYCDPISPTTHAFASLHLLTLCHRLMCLTSHWARKCINCYSKQRAFLGALVQKMKYFSFSFFMCCWRRSRVLWIRNHGFWVTLQQRFDEGLISEMAWWFSLLWPPYKAALHKSATRHSVMFHTMSVRVVFFFLLHYDSGSLDSCLPSFFSSR